MDLNQESKKKQDLWVFHIFRNKIKQIKIIFFKKPMTCFKTRFVGILHF